MLTDVTRVPQHLCARLPGLLLVNVLHQHTLVLEHVTLALHVQQVIPVVCNDIYLRHAESCSVPVKMDSLMLLLNIPVKCKIVCKKII